MPNPRDVARDAQTCRAVDPLAVMRDRLEQLCTRRTEKWWDIGVILDEATARRVGGSKGAGALLAYVCKTLEVKPRRARLWMRLSRALSRDAATRFGEEKLGLLMELLDARAEALIARDPLRTEVLSVAEDGSVSKVPFAEATTRDLKAAVRRARRGQEDDLLRTRDKATLRVRDALQARVRERMGPQAPNIKIHRQSFDGHSDALRLAMLDVEPAALEALGRVLLEMAKQLRKPGVKAPRKTAEHGSQAPEPGTQASGRKARKPARACAAKARGLGASK